MGFLAEIREENWTFPKMFPTSTHVCSGFIVYLKEDDFNDLGGVFLLASTPFCAWSPPSLYRKLSPKPAHMSSQQPLASGDSEAGQQVTQSHLVTSPFVAWPR